VIGRCCCLALVVGACGSDSGAARNRVGVIGVPGAGGGEVERFVRGDAEDLSLSVGVTLGVVWSARPLYAPPARFDSLVIAVNPFVRYYFWQPADWFATAWDAKLSFVLVAPGRGIGDLRLVPALESHLALSFQKDPGYLLIGAGIKQFLTRSAVTRDGQVTEFPGAMTMPAGEASLGLQW
jgi:hypothetical protein